MKSVEEIKKNISSFDKETKKKKIRKAITSLNTIISESNSLFCEREDVINTAIVCLITGTHHLQYGPAGTAKSMITRFLNSKIKNSMYFERLLTKSSDESLLFGPYSLKGLENDEYRRNISGKLPEANIAFIDEIYKSNSAILNSMLDVMNEKRYFNGDNNPIQLPLISMFGASNEIPEEDSSLEALHDRFLMRLYVDDIKDPSNMITVYENNLQNLFEEVSTPSISVEDIFLLNEFCKKIRISSDILQEYAKLIIELKSKGIRISTRRQVMLLRAVQGQALLNKRNDVVYNDFKIIRNGLWRKIEDFQIIDSCLAKFISPYATQYNEQMKKFKDLQVELDKQKLSTDSSAAIQKQKIIARMDDMALQLENYININKNIPKLIKQSFIKLTKEINSITQPYFEEQDKDLFDFGEPIKKKRGETSTPVLNDEDDDDDDLF